MPLLQMNIKVLLPTLLLALVCNLTALAQGTPSAGGCALVDPGRDSLGISFERIDNVALKRGDGGSGVLLRLHNNSSCVVIIRTTDAKKFVISPSAPFAPSNIRHDLNDGEVVPELTFFTQDARYSEAPQAAFGGDFFFEFNLPGGRSILFAVPVKYL